MTSFLFAALQWITTKSQSDDNCEKQIPFGDDNKKGKGKGRGKDRATARQRQNAGLR